MKPQASAIHSPKPETRKKFPTFFPVLLYAIFIFTIYFKSTPFLNITYNYNPPLGNTITIPAEEGDQPRRPSTPADGGESARNPEERMSNGPNINDDESADSTCDLFSGEWVPNPRGPYYTNATCHTIQEHQNCLKFGRPDTGFMKWRWKPDDCELQIFDPRKFLELVKGKSLGFVGDSVARNHVQSLICLLSRVVLPVDVSKPTDENILYQYPRYNFSISIISSPYLIRTEKSDPNDLTRPFHLYLDEFDKTWTDKIAAFDFLVISAGHWFSRPTYFHLNRSLAGCLYCPEPNVTQMTSSFSYRWAFRTALLAINGAGDFRGVAFLRTYSPSHFEGGPWDNGGDCVRTAPFRRNETAVEGFGLDMYRIQLEELETARILGRRTGVRLRLFDVTKPMLLRADGHPSKYGHWPRRNWTIPNDCVHWCLPGPIDAWNDLLQELLRREVGNPNQINSFGL